MEAIAGQQLAIEPWCCLEKPFTTPNSTTTNGYHMYIW